jgi:hypothetical protein
LASGSEVDLVGCTVSVAEPLNGSGAMDIYRAATLECVGAQLTGFSGAVTLQSTCRIVTSFALGTGTLNLLGGTFFAQQNVNLRNNQVNLSGNVTFKDLELSGGALVNDMLTFNNLVTVTGNLDCPLSGNISFGALAFPNSSNILTFSGAGTVVLPSQQLESNVKAAPGSKVQIIT